MQLDSLIWITASPRTYKPKIVNESLPQLTLSNSYTMGCPPVRGDNPRALANGLSYVQVDKHDITIFNTTYISVEPAHHDIVHAKVNNGGINTIPASIFI